MVDAMAVVAVDVTRPHSPPQIIGAIIATAREGASSSSAWSHANASVRGLADPGLLLSSVQVAFMAGEFLRAGTNDQAGGAEGTKGDETACVIRGPCACALASGCSCSFCLA